MEKQLLVSNVEAKKTRKFRLRKIFKRSRNKPGKEKFASLKEDQVVEESSSTVNISFSDTTNQSPFSPDDSFDSHFIFGGARSVSSPSRNRDLYAPEFTDPALAFQDETTGIDDGFAQLDVNILERHRSGSARGFHDSSMHTISSSSEDSNLEFGHQLVYRGKLGGRRPSLGAIKPAVTTDEGTEVVLRKTEQVDVVEDTEEDGIFLSFKSPKLDTIEQAFNTSDQFTSSVESDQVAARKRLSLEKALEQVNNNTTAELSPALSKESRLTWVSHEEDCESTDARPVKEIAFPSLTGSSFEKDRRLIEEEVFFENDGAGVEVGARAELESVRDAIFATFEGDDENSEITMELRKVDAEGNGLNGSSNRLPNTSKSTLRSKTEESKPSNEAVNMSSESVTKDLWGSIPSNDDFTKPVHTPASPKSPGHSSAFLKRKSAFTGKDLLTVEAESFAKFLEDEKQQQSPSLAKSSPAPEKFNNREDLLLSALASSYDASDDDAAKIRCKASQCSQSKTCATTSFSHTSTTHSKSSSPAFSKALSFDTFEALSSHRSAEETSTSCAASTSYAPSTIGGSMTRYEQQKDDNYCGIFSDDDDELTVRSEDFSSSRASPEYGSRPDPDLLDDIRLGLLETVQDLAREGSSVMMKLMK